MNAGQIKGTTVSQLGSEAFHIIQKNAEANPQLPKRSLPWSFLLCCPQMQCGWCISQILRMTDNISGISHLLFKIGISLPPTSKYKQKIKRSKTLLESRAWVNEQIRKKYYVTCSSVIRQLKIKMQIKRGLKQSFYNKLLYGSYVWVIHNSRK